MYECLDLLRAHLLQLEDDVRSAVDADDNLSDVANLRQVAPVSYIPQKNNRWQEPGKEVLKQSNVEAQSEILQTEELIRIATC